MLEIKEPSHVRDTRTDTLRWMTSLLPASPPPRAHLDPVVPYAARSNTVKCVSSSSFTHLPGYSNALYALHSSQSSSAGSRASRMG